MVVSSDTSAATPALNVVFEKELLHAAGVLIAPVAFIALLLLYCASGRDRWKHQKTPEGLPLVRPPPRSTSPVSLPVVVERSPPPKRPPRETPLNQHERVGPTGVFLGVRPNSNAMRSTGF